MHIALVISSLNPGGAERVLSQLANNLASKNKITLITLSAPDVKPFYQLDKNINLIQLNLSYAGSSFLKKIKNNLKRIIYLRRIIRNTKPNIVISFIDGMNIMALLATMALKIPIIISERTDPAFYILPKLHTWLRLKLYPYCYNLVVQTESAAQYFPIEFKKFITIIPNPVPTPKLYKTNFSGEIKNIITVGRLNSQKDHITLIKAFYRLIKNYPEITLTIYGEGEERRNIEQLIQTLKLQDKILLPGTIKNIYEALLKADLFIFPSRYEGFPNALCEAMAIGLPVIASNCSGNIDIIQDGINGRLFPIGNIEKLVNITKELLEDPQQSIKLASNARDICNNFSPEIIFKLWDQMIYNCPYLKIYSE